jgi:hypothetical protein
MPAKTKLFTPVKNFFRMLLFYGAWLVPLFAFYFWIWQHAVITLSSLKESSLSFAFAAVAWWILSFPVLFALQMIWPALLLIFMKTERERSPKRIIPIGERFRQAKLSSPQIFVLQEKVRLWRNLTWGFFAVPRPLGALLLVDKSLSVLMRPEQFDVWICAQAAEARFARSSRGRFSFFALVPTLTLLFTFAVTSLGDGGNSLPILSLSLGFILSSVLWAFLQIKRQAALDIKTIAHFELDPHLYFSTLEEIGRLNPAFNPWTRNLQKRNLLSRAQKLGALTWVRPWFASALAPAFLALTFVGIHFGHKESDAFFALSTKLIQPLVENKVKVEPKPETQPEHTAVQAPSVVVPAKPSSISQAVLSGDMRAVIQLVGHGENLQAGDPALNGATPLLLALKNSDLEMTYMLLSMGSQLRSEADKAGRGPLFYALDSIHQKATLSYILAAHVDARQKSLEGLTPYDWAVKNGWHEAAEQINKYTATEERWPATERIEKLPLSK